MLGWSGWLVGVPLLLLLVWGGGVVRAAEAEGEDVVLGEGTVEADLGSSREASRTDSEVSLASLKEICFKFGIDLMLIRFGFPF